MSIMLAVFHVVPVWLWGMGGAAVVTLVLLALFAPALFANILTSAGKLVAMIPWSKWQTWVVIAVLVVAIGGPLAFRVWLDIHDQALHAGDAKHEAAAVAARDTYWKGREDESNRLHAIAVAELKRDLEVANADAKTAQAALEARLRAQAARHDAERKTVEEEMRRNVNDKAIADCRLDRGVILQFNAGARRANGQDAAGGEDRAAAAGAGSINEPSGVALDTYARAVDATQDALGVCRRQVTGWQERDAKVVVPLIAKANAALQSCVPKGASP